LLDDSARSSLESWYIASVEELLGALYSVPEQIAARLSLEPERLEALRAEAENVLDPSVRKALADQAGRRYPVGGLRTAGRLAKRSAR
jgi:hypothetical protein